MNRFAARVQAAILEQRTIKAIAWFVITGALLYLLAVFWFGWQETTGAFAALGLQTLLIGVLISSSSYLWRFARWSYSLQCFGYAIPRFTHFAIYLSGLALTATPGKVGETFRSALLFQHGVRVTHSLAAFFVDRGTDVLGMILLGTLASTILGSDFAWLWLVSFASILLGSRGFAYLISRPVISAGWVTGLRHEPS